MARQFRVRVFGKKGCDKCDVLKQRLEKLLADRDWSEFEKRDVDVETEDGLVAFAEAECINPQRIPALLVERHNPDTGEYEPIPNSSPGAADPAFKQSKLYQYLGLQTDYTETGRGVIPPQMIKKCLAEARGA